MRQTIIGKLLNLKERDEREQHLASYSIKKIFLASNAILLFILFFCSIQISGFRPTDQERIEGKTGKVTLGLKFSLTDEDAVKLQPQSFEYHGLPLSKEALVLGMLLWQIISYRYAYRRIAGPE